MQVKGILRYFFLISLLFVGTIFLVSCGPEIRSFSVRPLTITEGDSVQVNWDVSGEPTLVVNEKRSQNDSSKKYLEFTLVVKKGDKEAVRLVQVSVLPNESYEEIVFSTTTLNGDTVIAAGDKNSEKWSNNFELIAISSDSLRGLLVEHAGIIVSLDSIGTPSESLKGKPLEGYWKIMSMLKESEKQNIQLAPEKLTIRALIKRKRGTN